ncbi:chalcone isomerase family protein [Colwellia piezophila]|uniref:chalcone isomerase family protein n=1 Tax=Colwellia piezophila TaxID=211668 RepID=UPI0003829C99|nr:chalcone isomerase family protein [Colwellia piezophila]
MEPLVSLFSTIILSLSLNVAAKTVADVEISPSITFGDKTLLVQGAGVRSKFFIDLYVASFFSEDDIKSKEGIDTASQEIIKGKKISAIRLNIVSGLITSEKMLASIEQSFDVATHGDTTAIDVYIAEFTAVFEQAITKQDQFTFISEPGVGVHVLKNNQPLSSITNDAFRQALLSIWLGTNSVDDDLKSDMLAR